MNRQKPPGIFAREARDTSDEYFEARIANCESVEHLQEAAKVEGESKARSERIATIYQRINELES